MLVLALLVVAALSAWWTDVLDTRIPWAAADNQSGATSKAIPRGTSIRQNALACQTLLTTSILPVTESKRLEARSNVGTDRLAVEIHGKVLRFMTRASVGVGQASPAEFQIVRNDDEVLAAVDYQRGGPGSSLSSFLLNKKNGLAVWTKSRPSFLVDEQPDTQAFYLQCQ